MYQFSPWKILFFIENLCNKGYIRNLGLYLTTLVSSTNTGLQKEENQQRRRKKKVKLG
jgi:hypothetical protein